MLCESVLKQAWSIPSLRAAGMCRRQETSELLRHKAPSKIHIQETGPGRWHKWAHGPCTCPFWTDTVIFLKFIKGFVILIFRRSPVSPRWWGGAGSLCHLFLTQLWTGKRCLSCQMNWWHCKLWQEEKTPPTPTQLNMWSNIWLKRKAFD